MFEEWLAEIECYGSRWERFIDEYTLGMMDIKRTKEWLEAAYRAGFEAGYKAPQAHIDEVV
jgi:hypothetical protein